MDTLIWDWNGTLMDDVDLCVRLLNEQLERHGYPPVGGIDAYRRVFGFPIEAYYVRAGFDFSRHPYEQLAHEYMERYVPESFACPMQPDARETLEALRARGVRQVILSASPIDTLLRHTDHYGVTQYFDAILGLDDVYGKSKVERGLAWIETSGIDRTRAAMVGDSVHDFEVASALGVRSVFYSRGHQPRETLEATGAVVIDSLRELLNLE